MSGPLVSIITPVYNGAKYLPPLIESVRNQDYPNIEHVMIDDGSTDGGATVEVLKSYPHLRCWSRENRGQYVTMNEGLEAAQGEIVCFISADDVMAAGAVSSAVQFLVTHPQADGVYGTYTMIDEQGSVYWYQPLVRRAPLSWYRYLPFIGHCSFYLRKEALIRHGLIFDATLRYTGDYDWMVRIAQARLRIGALSQTLSQVRWHPEQTTNTRVALIKSERDVVWGKYRVNSFLFKVINVGIDRCLIAWNILFNRQKRQEIRAWLALRKKA